MMYFFVVFFSPRKDGNLIILPWNKHVYISKESLEIWKSSLSHRMEGTENMIHYISTTSKPLSKLKQEPLTWF